jgi:hypothetical protein
MAVVLGLLAGGCTTSPPIGTGTLADAKARVITEVDATVGLLGPVGTFKPVTTADELPCSEHFLGYTVRHLAEHRAEVRDPLTVTGVKDGAALLPRVEQRWKARGYTVDTRGLSDRRNPKIRTQVGADEVIATGYVGHPFFNVYAVSPCVRS